jgi:protein disulfide-isomerase A1
MLRFGRVHSLPALIKYEAGDAEEELFSADVQLHLLYFHEGPLEDAAATALGEAAAALRGEAAVATVDATLHTEVSAFFDLTSGLGSLRPPQLMAFSLANATKFAHHGPLSREAVLSFARAVGEGSVAPHLRSMAEPPPGDGPLVELVGSTFAAVAHDSTKDVLVQFYAPSCGHCKKLRPAYEAVAAKFADEPSVVVAQIDAVVNDVAGFEPEGFPTIVLYTKDNKEGIEYDGSRDVVDLVQFVNDAREGKAHVGGLPELPPDATLDEDDGYRVEL